MSCTITNQILFQGLVDVIESVIDGLELSETIIDTKASPATDMDKSFSIDMQSKNTKKYRDHRLKVVLIENTVTVRIAHCVETDDEEDTQTIAFRDEENVIIALLNATECPVCQTDISYNRTKRYLNPAREWLYTDIEFTVTFDLDLSED